MSFNFSLNLDWAEQVARNAPQGQFLDLILTFLWFLNCTFYKKKTMENKFQIIIFSSDVLYFSSSVSVFGLNFPIVY